MSGTVYKDHEEAVQKLYEEWPEPKFEDVGSYYATMYQILMWRKARLDARKYGYVVEKSYIDWNKDFSKEIAMSAKLRAMGKRDKFFDTVARRTFFWDFTKDEKHQPKGLYIVSRRQLELASEYLGHINYGKVPDGQYALIDKSFHLYSVGTYDECSQKYKERKTAKRKAAAEKRDVVNYDLERTGLPDRRNGRNVTADEIRETFGLESVTVSESLAKKDATAELNALYDGLCDIVDVFNLADPQDVSLGGELSIDIGGKTMRNVLAHYDNENRVIEIAKKNRNSGTFIHEYFHAIEMIRGQDILDQISVGTNRYDAGNLDAFVNIMSHIRDRNSQYYQTCSKVKDAKYWAEPHEMFARAGETFFADELQKRGAENHFLLNQSLLSAQVYPSGKEREKLNGLYRQLITEFFVTREDPEKKITGIDKLRNQHNESTAPPGRKKTKGIDPDL